MIYYKQQKYTTYAAVSLALARKHWPLSAALHERPPLKTKGRVYKRPWPEKRHNTGKDQKVHKYLPSDESCVLLHQQISLGAPASLRLPKPSL